ncbi:hypothetical protein BDY24DRAFT_102163 [Mrakia frigida]|uniref:uncharacterized protein n=1 Tax=Mrakia frigida TaxID=29902 RepID=UPI003FCC098F
MDSASSTRLRLLTNASKSGPSESKDPGPSSLREASGENLDDLSAILFNLMVEVEEEEEEEQEADGSDESDGDGSSTSSLLQQSSSRAPVDGARTLRSRSSNLSSASSAASIKKGRKKVEKEEEEMDASVDGERPAEPDSKILIDGHEFLYRSLLNLKEPLEIPLDTVVTPFKKSIQAKAHSPNPTLSAYHVDAVVSNPDASLSVVLEALLPPAATVDDIQQLREWTLLVASYPTSVDHGKLAREFAAKNPSFGSRSALFQSLSDAKAAQTAALIQYRSFIAMVLLYVVLGQRSAVARFISSREGREMTFGEILLEKEPKQRGKGETRVLLMKYGSIFRDLWHVEGAYRAAVRSVKGTT